MAQNHVVYLGKLIGNLQSLEALLRVYLQKLAEKISGMSSGGHPYWSLSVGDVVPENAFSNFDSLGALVDKFNADVASRDSNLMVDRSVVDIRDLLAHGRVSADAQDLAMMRILKFDRPTSGSVRVTAAALMDDAWFETNIALVHAQIQSVHTAYSRYAA